MYKKKKIRRVGDQKKIQKIENWSRNAWWVVEDLLNKNFLSQQIESASSHKDKHPKKCIKGRKSEGVEDPEKNKKIENTENGRGGYLFQRNSRANTRSGFTQNELL